MGLEAPSHWIIIALIVIALFGYKKLPDASRSLARSLRIFKTEIKDVAKPEVAGEPMTDDPAPGPPAREATATVTPTPATKGAVAVSGHRSD